MNNRTIRLLSLGTSLAVGGLGILLVLLTLAALPNTAGLEDAVKNKKIIEAVDALLNGFFYLIYLAIGICTLLALLFGLLAAVRNPAKAKGSLIGLAALALVFILSWFISDDSVFWVGKRPDEIARLNREISSGARHFSGMAVNAMYILMLLAVAALAFGEVFRFLKTRR